MIRFDEKQVRAVGRNTRGVKGIKIKPKDTLISMDVIEPKDEKTFLLIITKFGYGKNIRISEFKVQNRSGIGVRSLKFRKTVKDDAVIDALTVLKEDEIMLVTLNGTMCRQKVQNISTQRRESQGVKIIKPDEKDCVTAMEKVIETIEE